MTERHLERPGQHHPETKCREKFGAQSEALFHIEGADYGSQARDAGRDVNHEGRQIRQPHFAAQGQDVAIYPGQNTGGKAAGDRISHASERKRSQYPIHELLRRWPVVITASRTVMQPNPPTVPSAAAVAIAATSFSSIGPGPAGRFPSGAAQAPHRKRSSLLRRSG